jgi:hypothetical protein
VPVFAGITDHAAARVRSVSFASGHSSRLRIPTLTNKIAASTNSSSEWMNVSIACSHHLGSRLPLARSQPS